MVGPYVPDRGEVVYLDFAPRAGHEQSGRRPALVLSPSAYNEKVGIALFCPITTRIKGYPFEVHIPDGYSVAGAILADQVKSLDWKAREAAFQCKFPEEILAETLERIRALLFDTC